MFTLWNRLYPITGACFIVAICAMSAVAVPYSSLVVFGDSLSDVGNIDAATPSFFKFPGRYYNQGRFSNGPVWVESLVTGLGLPAITRSTAGGNDFAYGGAQTTGTGGLGGLFISDIDEQVTEYLNTRTVNSNSLHVVFAGANDFDNGETDANEPANTLATQISRLVAAGARQFLVPNLPLLGLTPKYNTIAANASQMNALSTSFNSALATNLDTLDANPTLTIHRLDVAGLFSNAVAHPAAFGLTNVTQSAAPGLEPGDSSYNTNQIASQPNQYLFWDNLHPTTAVHSILAEQATDLLLQLPGDYNDDHEVNAADYTVWRNTLGVPGHGLAADGNRDGIVNAADFGVWKSNFGKAAAAVLAGGRIQLDSTVPEPTAFVAAVFALAIVVMNCRRKRQFA